MKRVLSCVYVFTLVQTGMATYTDQAVEVLKEQIKKPTTWCCSGYDISYANPARIWPLDLSGINLKESKLGGNTFKLTDFSDADLTRASFKGDKNNVTDLSDSLLYFAKNITTALCNKYTKLPEGFGCVENPTEAEKKVGTLDLTHTITIDPDVQELLQAVEKRRHEFAHDQKVINILKSDAEKAKLVRKLQYDVITWAINHLKNTDWEKYSTDDAQALKHILHNMVRKAYSVLHVFVVGAPKEYKDIEKFIGNLKTITTHIFEDVALFNEIRAKQYDVTTNMPAATVKKVQAWVRDILRNTAPVVKDVVTEKLGQTRAMWFFILKPEWDYPADHFKQDLSSLSEREEKIKNLLNDVKNLRIKFPADFGARK